MDEPLNHGPAGNEDDASGMGIVSSSGISAADSDSAYKRNKSRRGEGGRQDENNKNRTATGDYGNVVRTKQCVSPPKKRRPGPVFEERRTPLQSGIVKLVEASVRYHPDRDGVLKQGFAGEGLTPPELREMLRRLFQIKLTEPELSAVFAHFVPDGGMELDGNVFIIHFIQMGQAERDRRRVEHLEIERQFMAQKAKEQANLLQPLDPSEALNNPEADGEWGPEDEASAMAMVIEAAVAYDKYSPAAVSLDAFEGATMTPLVFKEQLRRVFNIKLAPPQLAALMAVFDKDNDGTVDCAEFLLRFFLIGFQERSKRLEIRREGERKRREKEEAEAETRRAEAEERARLKVDYQYTSDEQASGLAKLVEAAVAYDATGPASLGLGAFQGDSMPPHVFREQLRKVFSIRLTPVELGGVMHRFDKDGDGTVDVVEFTKAFFKMGFDERTKRTKERRDTEAKRLALQKEEEIRNQREADKKNALKVSNSFSEKHVASALAKITKAAARYDKNHPSAVALDAFGGAQMEPHVFREQLKRAFAIKLTPPELGAAINAFDKDGDGLVSCPEFLLTFFRLGFEARGTMTAERREHARKMAGRAAEEVAERERERECRAAVEVSDDFDEADRASAMAKIADAASRYDKNHPSCLGLDGFEGALMPPHIFKEQLKRVFGIKLSPGELGAVMEEFDKDGDGTVNCAEFLLTFFRVGFETRNKALQRRREEGTAKAKRVAKEESQRQLETEIKRAQAALAPYTEKDLDDTLDMLIESAARYERRQLGPAGLKAWEVKSMTPAELKEALRRTFDLRVSPPQLGAITHLFGTGDGSGGGSICEGVLAPPVQIGVPEFLTTFFKMSTAAKGLAAGNDAVLKLKEYRIALKERLVQQEEVRRTLKAMRDNPPKRALTVDSGLTRAAATGGKRGTEKRGGPAMDPMERIRSHLNAAKSTRRLDLSTWTDRKQGDFLLTKIPRTVWHLTGLTELWLTNNDLQAIPPQIRELQKLRTLGVGRNRIGRLPVELGVLADLEHIFAEKNWLSTLPKELAMCRNLRELRLDENQFSRLPDCVPELRSLEVLDLRGNTIASLPHELKYLRSLLDLDLDENPIGPEVPEALFSLVNLAHLSLAGTLLGPTQGEQLEARLRLDSLCVNPDAPPSHPPPSRASTTPEQRVEGDSDTPPPVDGRFQLASVRRRVCRSTSVPDERLHELRDQIPDYSTRRLPGLDLLPADTKAMMKAKAHRRRATNGADGTGAADRPRSGGAGAGTLKGGGGQTHNNNNNNSPPPIQRTLAVVVSATTPAIVT